MTRQQPLERKGAKVSADRGSQGPLPRSRQESAGLLLYRTTEPPEVLLGHPGGPFWANKHEAAWTIPKGVIGPDETPLAAARREFFEETGHRARGRAIGLGEARQPGGKLVHVWAVPDGWNPAKLRSCSFQMEWPPKSGRRRQFPELDQVAWFTIGEARRKILKGQAVFLDRLETAIDRRT